MLIRELFIRLYGPLSGRAYTLAKGFNLLMGPNEAGKSLAIDALVKFLLGRQAREKEFEKIGRVAESPEGYLLLEDAGGETVKLPEGGSLAEIAGLTPAEWSNIFVVRNSNLSIARPDRPEGDFYTSITERLTGLRTSKISEVKRRLYDMARITEKGFFKNVSGNKLKDRLEEARLIADKTERLLERLQEADYEELEQEQVDCAGRLTELEGSIENMERTRKREQYLKGLAALNQLRSAAEAADALERFNEEDKQRWADAERDIQRLSEEKEGLRAELEKKEQAVKQITGELGEKQQAFNRLDERKKILDEELRPELRSYSQKEQDFARREGGGRLLLFFFGTCAAALILSLLAAIFSPSLIFTIIAVLSGLSAAGLGLALFRLAGERGALVASLGKMRALFSRFGLAAGGADEMRAALQTFEEEHAARQDEFGRLQMEKSGLAREIGALCDKELPRITGKTEAATRAIEALKLQSGAGSLAEYAARLAEKQNQLKLLDEQRAVLSSLFGEEAPDEKKGPAALPVTTRWETALNELAGCRETAGATIYSEKDVTALREERRALQEKMRSVKERLEEFSRELQGVEREANLVLQTGAGGWNGDGSGSEYLLCQTATDLREIGALLRAFLREHEERREDAQKVISIFEQIEDEEKERVSALFGKASPISGHFREITGGLYDEVRFDRESNEIHLLRSGDGARLSAGKLSGGAYDQLYLSVRLALGEKLLKGEKGFFIFDDPFIKSDTARLRRQLQTLLAIAGKGWQIVYFTAKDEVREALKSEISQGSAGYLQIGEA